jgi:hypothetical protein
MPAKPRNTSFKDSVVAYLTLKAHFSIADNHPKDTNCAQLGKLMLVQQQNHSGDHGAPMFVGEYYEACKLFCRENDAEMKQNNISVDSLLKSQASTYWNGENLWSKASTIKRQLLNEIHTVFCQEVNKQWASQPSGTSLEDLMLELRKKLFAKKAKELKDSGVDRAEKRVQELLISLEQEQEKAGLLSETYLSRKKIVDEAETSLQKVKDEAMPEFDPDWYPTLWRAYRAFGPSESQPHGHGGFLSPHAGAYLSNGPLPADVGLASPENGSRAEPRKRARPPLSPSPTSSSSVQDGKSSSGRAAVEDSTHQDRILVALEKTIQLAEIQMRSQSTDNAIRSIREMLDTFGDEMSEEERQSHRARLRALYSEKIAGAGGAGGAGAPH